MAPTLAGKHVFPLTVVRISPYVSRSEVIVPIKLGHDGGAIGLRDDDNAGAVVVQRMPVFDAPFGLRFLVTVFQALLDFAIRDRAPLLLLHGVVRLFHRPRAAQRLLFAHTSALCGPACRSP